MTKEERAMRKRKIEETKAIIKKLNENTYSEPDPEPGLRLNEVDVHKLNLQPGDAMVIAVKNDDMRLDDLQGLRNIFRKMFPNNQMVLLNLGSNGDIKFTVASQPEKSYSCGDSQSPGYCSDCDCGKKERVEAEKNG